MHCIRCVEYMYVSNNPIIVITVGYNYDNNYNIIVIVVSIVTNNNST